LGVLSCYDRIVVTGTLATVRYAEGTTGFLHAQGICIFAYASFAMELRESVRQAATRPSAAAGIEIEHIARVTSAKEAAVANVLEDGAITPA